MIIETKYKIGDEVWWKRPHIRHGKVYGVWNEIWGVSYGIIQNNRLVYVEESLLFPTKEELLKSL